MIQIVKVPHQFNDLIIRETTLVERPWLSAMQPLSKYNKQNMIASSCLRSNKRLHHSYYPKPGSHGIVSCVISNNID